MKKIASGRKMCLFTAKEQSKDIVCRKGKAFAEHCLVHH
jgi:hypothetical protein